MNASLAVACAVLLSSASGLAATGEQWIRRIDSLYNASPSWQVAFKQTVRYPVFDETETDKGKFTAGPKGRFRLEAKKQIIVSDGDTLWTHNVAANQLTVECVDGTNEMVRPADFLFHFRESYAVELCDNPGPGQCLHMTSTDETSFIRQMWLWSDPKTATVARAVYKDINGNETTFEFSKINLKYKAKKADFRYATPPGVEIVRMP
jgi:outer membrane lipoprotein-sorting protein